MPRNFNSTTGRIGFTPVATSSWGSGLTIAAIVRRNSAGNYHTMYYRGVSGGFTAGQPAFGINNSNVMYLEVGASATSAITVGAGHWLVAVTKATGTATPRFHAFDLDTPGSWTHTNGGATVGNPATAVQTIEEVGRWNGTSGDYWDGDFSCLGVWHDEMTDGEVESLLLGFVNWKAKPGLQRLYHFHQADTADTIIDLAGTGSNEINDTGTSVATTSGLSWSWGATPVTGGVVVAGGVTHSTTAAITGTGTIAATGVRHHATTAAVAGTGAVAATAVRHRVGTVAITGSGVIAATGLRHAASTAAITGTGTIAATAKRTAITTAALAGSGVVAATGLRHHLTTGAIAGSGAVAATGARTFTTTTAVAGQGTIAASGTVTHSTTASIVGTGTISAASGAITYDTTAAIVGTGAIAATAVRHHITTCAIAGSGAISGTCLRRAQSTAAIAGTGAVAATCLRRAQSTVGVLGTGTISGTPSRRTATTVELGGVGTISATADGVEAPPTPGIHLPASEGGYVMFPASEGSSVALAARYQNEVTFP